MDSKASHSEEYINDTRLDWWRRGHLLSILDEVRCKDVKSALDVGVGQGHWTALLFGCFPSKIAITGVDFEDQWVAKSNSYVPQALPVHSFNAVKGDVNSLSFADGSFDLVTSQTVLMHVAEPRVALSEMVRVLKPNGWLLIAEPMNQLNRAVVAHALASKDANASSILWRIWRIYHERKRTIKGFDHNIAASLPTLLKEQPIHDLQGFHSDVVSIEGPVHNDLKVFISELRKEEAGKILREAGIMAIEIEECCISIEAIIADLNDRTIMTASSVPNILFAAKKNQKVLL